MSNTKCNGTRSGTTNKIGGTCIIPDGLPIRVRVVKALGDELG